MDVNGTRIHLIQGETDWRQSQEVGYEAWTRADWNSDTRSVLLKSRLTLFPRGKRDRPLQPDSRRGSAVDKYGNWYWISEDKHRIYWLPRGDGKAQLYWEQTPVPTAVAAGEFYTLDPPPPTNDILSGLTITSHHYLVVGNQTQGGLFIFDLHAGGPPTLELFPPEVKFKPFDMAPRRNGGVWILDRENGIYWGLDRQFRVMREAAYLSPLGSDSAETDQPPFQPAGGAETIVCPGRAFPEGFKVGLPNLISIVALPDDQVLLLDNPPAVGKKASQLYRFYLDEQIGDPVPLVDTQYNLHIIGYDMAYTAGTRRLYAVELDGNQVIAFDLTLEKTSLTIDLRSDYLPMHFFGGRALVAEFCSAETAPDENNQLLVYYDVVGRQQDRDIATRWVSLQAIDQPRFEREATLETQIFDGKGRDCVWHRLFLEGCIPAETAVAIWTRAHNDKDLLATVAYNREPDLYLRHNETELPYYQPFPETERKVEGQGTWELLMQAANGRYLQIKIRLTGNGRVTPQLRALRAYYPRFSYPDNYLPSLYLGQDTFLERLLANMEGSFTELEGKIVEVSRLFDGRRAPPEALDWLAGWLGLMMDPLWAQIQANRAKNSNGLTSGGLPGTPSGVAPDRRRLFIRYARKLYERRGTVDGIRYALHLFLDPCLEATLRYFKTAAINPESTLPERLARYNLTAPTPTTPETGFEDLLYEYILARPSKIRLVEQFQTRGGRAFVVGDTTAAGEAAHKFTVLIPEDLPAEEEAMVNRIINLEKPAHTGFVLRRYWDGFRVGEARLGIDTTVDLSSRFRKFILGRDTLATAYLEETHPFNVRERFVSDRDGLGNLPPL